MNKTQGITKKVQFSIDIAASPEKVWHALWDDANYRAWTSVFTEGSHALTDNWKEGSKVLFLGPDGSGMYSIVARNIPNEFMSFEHHGEVKNHAEIPMPWAGAHEDYYLAANGDTTTLRTEMDASPEFEAFFNATFPQALQKIKELAEA
jgi:uncharacterized protein YndB with AHSA1/START domain